MIKKYFFYSPIPFRYIMLSGLIFGLILIASSYLAVQDSESTSYGNFNHSILTFWKYTLWPFFIPGINILLNEIRKKEDATSKVVFSVLLIIFFAITHSVVSNIFYYLTLWPIIGSVEVVTQLPQFFEYFVNILISRILDGTAIVSLVLAISFYEEYSEKKSEIILLKSELREAELTALRNQLKPHFLFNSLNTISSLIDQDPERAQKVLAKVAQLLRSNLDQSKKNIIQFNDELDIVRDYLEIEMERFNDRFTVFYNIEEEALVKYVPNLFLQPLVENALKHGVYKTIHPVILSLDAKIVKDELIVKVKDDGLIHNPVSDNNGLRGVGIQNLEARLDRLYNGKASLRIEVKEKEFFEVSIKIPIKKSVYED